jgi:hypothetical protein
VKRWRTTSAGWIVATFALVGPFVGYDVVMLSIALSDPMGRAGLLGTILTPKGMLSTLMLSVAGYFFGILPAGLTGLVAAFMLRKLPVLAYVAACVAVSLLTCVQHVRLLLSGAKPTGMGEIFLYVPAASGVAALVCALLTLRRDREA